MVVASIRSWAWAINDDDDIVRKQVIQTSVPTYQVESCLYALAKSFVGQARIVSMGK